MTDLTARPWLTSYAKGVPHDLAAPTQTLVEMLTATIKRPPTTCG